MSGNEFCDDDLEALISRQRESDARQKEIDHEILSGNLTFIEDVIRLEEKITLTRLFLDTYFPEEESDEG